MSLGSNIGAEAAAEELSRFIEALMKSAGFDELSPRTVAERIKAEADEIAKVAKAGWY